MRRGPLAEKPLGLASAIVAGLFCLIGVTFLGAGIWLFSLGGTAYYLISGVAVLWTGALLFRRKASALWLFALVVLSTLAWAVWEAGLDWWAMVPRGDRIFLMGLALFLPFIRLRLHGTLRNGGELLLGGSLVIAAAVGVIAMLTDEHARPGVLPPALAAVPAGYAGVADADWPAYGRSLRGDRWSPLSEIAPANVDKLQVAWTYRTGDLRRPGDPSEFTYEVTPINVADTVYLCTPHNIVIALDADTGAEKWRFDPEIRVQENMQHLTCRGVGYHSGSEAECPQRIIATTNDSRLIALDALTGKPCQSFGEHGQVMLDQLGTDYRPGWHQFTSAPLVTRELIVLGGAIYDNADVTVPSGVIRAFNVDTGALVWNFDPGNPDDTAPLATGQSYVPSTPNSWGTSTADEDLGLVYIPMGMGAVDQWGGDRPETTERFATSIVALELATGHLRWVYQAVHHDLWDMDLGAQPTLVDLKLATGEVPALIQPTKTGDLFILDRRTGQPVYPAPEQSVPGGAAAGDFTAPTQPFSTVSLRPDPIEETGLWGVTPFDQLACRIMFRRLRYAGPYTPPSEQGTLVYPGNFGVFDWGGIAVDPERQIAFTNPNAMAFVDRLVPQAAAPADAPQDQPSSGNDIQGNRQEGGLNPNTGAPFAVALNAFLSPLGLPCQAPPWGTIAGVDLTTGKVAYQRRDGTIRDNSPLPLPLRLGVPALGGPLLTRGGVAFLTSTLDQYIRAYDVTTGAELWHERLPAGAQATPMTYRGPGGRQFVVTVAGGHGSLGTAAGDYVIAYALLVNSGP